MPKPRKTSAAKKTRAVPAIAEQTAPLEQSPAERIAAAQRTGNAALVAQVRAELHR